MRARQNGLSLTELMVVLVIISIAIIPIFGLLSENTRQVAFNQDRAVAQMMASHVIERYRYEQFDSLFAKFTTPEVGAATIAADMVLNELVIGIPEHMERLYFKFKREAWFEEIHPGLSAKFVCRVTWTNSQRQDKELTMTTIIRNKRYHHGAP